MRTLVLAAAVALALTGPARADEHAVSGTCEVFVVRDSDLDATVAHLTVRASATAVTDLPLVDGRCVVVAPDGRWVHETWASGVGEAVATEVVSLPGVGYRACMYSSAWYLVRGGSVSSDDGCRDL